MARRTYKPNNPGTEDTTTITASYTSAMNAYKATYGPAKVGDLIQQFDGNKGNLARALSGVGSGKLPAKGTDNRKAYDAAQKSISRWLASETGSGKQARKPDSASQEKLNKLFQPPPPKNMSITISGSIGYDGGDFRERTISMGEGTMYRIDAGAFVSAMQAGDTHAAYGATLANYAPLVIARADTVDIQFSGDGFSGDEEE